MPLSIGIGISPTKISDAVSALFSGMPTPTWAIDFARDQYSTLSPALTVSSPTGGVMVPDYLGNYHKTLANEIPIRGGRRVENLVKSEALNDTDWTYQKAGTTVTEDAETWTIGGYTISASKIAELATLDHHRIGHALGGSASNDRYFTLYAKAAERDFVRAWSWAGGNTNAVIFDLGSGTIASDLVGGASIEDAGNGIYRCTVVVPADNSSAVVVGPCTSPADNDGAYAGTAGHGVLVGGVMLVEKRPGQTSPDPEYVSRGVPIGHVGEFAINGGFDTDAGWNKSAGWTISGGTAVATAVAPPLLISQINLFPHAGTFEVQFTVLDYVSGAVSVYGPGYSADVQRAANGTYTEVVTVTSAGNLEFKARNSLTTLKIDNVSVKEIRYHGYGVDGLAWMRTDPEGNSLADGFGPELVTNGGPGFVNDSGWSSTTTTRQVVDGDLIATAVDGSSDRAEYAFTGLTVGATYRVRARVASSVASVGVSTIQSWTIGSINTINVDHTDFREYEFDFVCTSASGAARFYADVSSGVAGKSIKIREFSVREVYPVPCTGIADWPQVTNLATYSCDIANGAWGVVATATKGTPEAGPIVGELAVPLICLADADRLEGNISGLTTSATYTTSFLVKSSIPTTVRVGGIASGIPATTVAIGTEYQWVTATEAAAGTTRYPQIRATEACTLTIAACQVEPGASRNPLVITEGLAVTADAIVKTLDDSLIGWVAGGGTWVIEHTPELPVTASASLQVLLDLQGAGTEWAILYNQGGNFGVFVRDAANVQQWSASAAAAAWTPGQLHRIAWRLEEDDGSLVTDGVERLTDSAMTVPGVNAIYLGGKATSHYAGSIGAIAYYAAGA